MSNPSIIVPDNVLAEMEAHAAGSEDAEICGLIIGRFTEQTSAEAVEYVPIDNIAPEPLALFTMDPQQQLEAFEKAFSQDMQIVGCFHSHPKWRGRPSSIDLNMANEEYFWLIWGGVDQLTQTWYYDSDKEQFLGAQLNERVCTEI